MQNATSRSKIGATCIVAGTAIGAGMLGLPMAIGKLGFMVGTIVMVVVWALAVYSALLLLEVNLKIGAGENFNNMARKVLGRGGQVVATGSMVFLHYALLVAYLTGVGELISRSAGSVGLGISAGSGTLYFAILGGLVILWGTHLIVRVNQLLFFVMIAAMVAVLASLAPGVEVQNLSIGLRDNGLILASLPVLFTSFGFHASIPSIIRYLKAPAKELRTVTLIGSFIPFACYLLWLLVAVGGTGLEQLEAMKSVDVLVSTLAGGSGALSSILSTFAALALLTSFFGVSLALFDLLAEVFKLNNSMLHRAMTALMVFLPPVVAALLCPGRFIQALAHAGAALAILAIFLPCAMAWKLRRGEKPLASSYQVFGGTPALVLASLFGLIIVTASYI